MRIRRNNQEAVEFIGTVSNFPRRRAVHQRLFFLELSLYLDQTINDGLKAQVFRNNDDHHNLKSTSSLQDANKAQVIKVQVLLKYGQGGCYWSGPELERLRRDIRQGDTIRVFVGRQESIHNGKDILFHATMAEILTVHVHGNTGHSYQIDANNNHHNTLTMTVDTKSSRALREFSIQNINDDPNDDFHSQYHQHIDQAIPDNKEVHLPSKKERFAVFCDFLISTFGPLVVAANNHQTYNNLHFFDIAGGRGELSLLLTLQGYRVTLIDPRENAGMMSSRSRKQLRKSGMKPFHVERIFFDQTTPSAIIVQEQQQIPTPSLLLQQNIGDANNNIGNDKDNYYQQESSGKELPVLVGLHPDEATEAIVDGALAHGLPFAVVPCCVYSRLFPHRRYQGQPVRTHQQFCSYLQSKEFVLPANQKNPNQFSTNQIGLWRTCHCFVLVWRLLRQAVNHQMNWNNMTTEI